MKFANSEECSKSELDLFSVPPTQVTIEDGVFDDIKPHPSFKENTVVFDVTGDSSHYIDMASTELWVKLRLQRKPDTTVEDATFDAKSDVGPANNILHTIFQQTQVYLNGKEVENSNSCYPYKAYLNNLLSHNREDKETFLAMEGFVKDTPTQMTNFQVIPTTKTVTTGVGADAKTTTVNNPIENGNEGLITRHGWFKANQPVQLRGRLHCDIFNINRYLISNVNVTVKLTRSKPEFYLMGKSEKHFITIEETFLRVRRVKISPSIMLEHAMALEKTTAKYPIKRVVVKQFTLPYNASKASINGICSGIMPTRVLVSFLHNKDYDGVLTGNCFNFRHLGITHLSLKLSSKAVPYSSGIEMDYDNNCYMQAYNTLFQNIREKGNDITYAEYKHGHVIYAFDLSPDLCSSAEHFSAFKDGSLDLEIDFKQSVEQSLTTIFYLEYNNLIEITRQRNVVFDYQV
jgi:hypothetical protein